MLVLQLISVFSFSYIFKATAVANITYLILSIMYCQVLTITEIHAQTFES